MYTMSVSLSSLRGSVVRPTGPGVGGGLTGGGGRGEAGRGTDRAAGGARGAARDRHTTTTTGILRGEPLHY